MLFYYIKIAYRNLLRYKIFSAINILGLSFSMSVCLLIITIINDQLSHDSFHKKDDRIYRIVTEEKSRSQRPNFLYATTVMPMAEELKNEYTGVEEVVRITKTLKGDAKFGDNIGRVKGIFADQSFLEVFSFELKAGDQKTALADPYSVVLNEETAFKFFKGTDAIGKTMEIGDQGLFTVTGILKEPPAKSHIKFDIIGSASTITLLEKAGKHFELLDNWEKCSAAYVYVLLEDDAEEQLIHNNLNEIAQRHADVLEDRSFSFELQKLSSITPGPLMSNSFSQTLPIEALIFLGVLALIVTLSACFNYTNLTISRALTRAKEVGLRKVTGASRWQIITQFLSESIIFSLVSLAGSILIFNYLLDAFNQMYIAQEISMNFQTITTTYGWFVVFSILIGIIAGLTPAVFLSSFKPISALKNLSGIKLFSRVNLRKSLIVLQFTLSLFFIITTIIISKQSDLLINSEYGFTKENIINIKLQDAGAGQFLTAIKKRTDVIQASACSHIPVSGQSFAVHLRRNVEDEDKGAAYFDVDQLYLDNLDLNLIAGQNFPINASTKNEQFVILNEAAIKDLDFENAAQAIGHNILLGRGDSTFVQIIGVVKDYNYSMLLSKIKPLALRYRPGNFQYAQVRIKSNDIQASIAGIEKEWKKFDPVHAFDYQFFDDQVEQTYGFVKDLRGIIGITAILSVIIASLGLLGMAIYNAESRVKEVGIRKVMGADVLTIAMHLSKGFFILIVLAILLATPLAYFTNNLWLHKVATRISVGPQIISMGILILFGIGILTIGSQSIRAALTNPINSLRDE